MSLCGKYNNNNNNIVDIDIWCEWCEPFGCRSSRW